MNLNPLALLDALLMDWVSARTRRTIHTLLLLTFLLVSIWLAADGEWAAFLGSLAAALYAGSNTANTHPEDPGFEPDDEASEVG